MLPGGRIQTAETRLGREVVTEDTRGGSAADRAETREGVPQEAGTHAEGIGRGRHDFFYFSSTKISEVTTIM